MYYLCIENSFVNSTWQNSKSNRVDKKIQEQELLREQ